MIQAFLRFGALLTTVTIFLAAPLSAQNGPLRITVTEGVIEPVPFALPDFQAETGGAGEIAVQISQVIASDLAGTGLFRQIPPSAFISSHSNFGQPVAFADWRAINAQALITGAVSVSGQQMLVKFRLFDVFSGAEMGEGMQFSAGSTTAWRRLAHKVADEIYRRLTGELPYFDSRVVFVSESGPKGERIKRLAVMDYDGANVQYLTDSSALVLAPRFSADGRQVLYTTYESGFPRINVLDMQTVQRRQMRTADGDMSFSPRFSPDGRRVIYSLTTGGNTDLFATDLSSGAHSRLTSGAAIETAPSFSPDGSQIVFESDQTGTPQLYIMSAGGGQVQQISRGQGRYGTPVWSPRGDLIAFTKQQGGRFHIGVMRTNGSEERLLTASFLDEGPTWAPNGRVIMFFRETQGADGAPSLYSVDISGRNLRQVRTPNHASDPSWGPLLR